MHSAELFVFFFQKEYDNIWFTGHHLISLLDLVLSLPEGAETDLLQNSDRWVVITVKSSSPFFIIKRDFKLPYYNDACCHVITVVATAMYFKVLEVEMEMVTYFNQLCIEECYNAIMLIFNNKKGCPPPFPKDVRLQMWNDITNE